jgi:hypothetical protein
MTKVRKRIMRRKRARVGDVILSPGKSTTSTVVIDGKRVLVRQRMDKDGVIRTTTTNAAILESDLQAAQVEALRAHPLYGMAFTLAGDMGAGKRGPQAQADAVRTGLESGEPDLRIYIIGGKLLSVENKAEKTPVSKAQKDRHALLHSLGFQVEIIRTTTCDMAVHRVMLLMATVVPGFIYEEN